MRNCTVSKKMNVVPGDIEDYNLLSHYHYRDSRIGPFAAIYSLKPDLSARFRIAVKTAGVIVYTMPTPALELRNVATGGIFTGLQRADRLAIINKNIRCISRVIVEPRFRSLGLAARLVRETMPLMNVPIIEAMAVMGLVNPFFEKAGMKKFSAKTPARCARLIEAFNLIGIEKRLLINPQFVQQKIDKLPEQKAEFIEYEIRSFLQSYGRRRNMLPGLERTRFIMTKLTDRPLYYVWLNTNLKFST